MHIFSVNSFEFFLSKVPSHWKRSSFVPFFRGIWHPTAL